MSLRSDRLRAEAAAIRLVAQRSRLHERSGWLLDRLERYRPMLVVGGGLLAGWLIGRRRLSQTVKTLLSGVSLSLALLRSSLGPLAVSALSGRLRRPTRSPNATVRAQG